MPSLEICLGQVELKSGVKTSWYCTLGIQVYRNLEWFHETSILCVLEVMKDTRNAHHLRIWRLMPRGMVNIPWFTRFYRSQVVVWYFSEPSTVCLRFLVLRNWGMGVKQPYTYNLILGKWIKSFKDGWEGSLNPKLLNADANSKSNWKSKIGRWISFWDNFGLFSEKNCCWFQGGYTNILSTEVVGWIPRTN